MSEFSMGSAGKWGVRGIMRKRQGSQWSHMIAQVSIRSDSRPIEERRAERDAIAQMIVDALNHWHERQTRDEFIEGLLP